jgi:hypothetical protein
MPCNASKNASLPVGLQHTIFDRPMPTKLGISQPIPHGKRAKETAKRRAEGRCIGCGKPSAPKVTCYACGQKKNAYRDARKKNKQPA